MTRINSYSLFIDFALNPYFTDIYRYRKSKSDRYGGVPVKTNEPVDYLAAIEQLRQKEQSNKNQIHAPEFTPTPSEKPVDYLAASRAWEKAQSRKIYHLYD